MSDLWLVRTVHHWIAGPYSSETLKQLIREGKLALDDEICAANGDWFMVRQEPLLQKHLGIALPLKFRAPNFQDATLVRTSTFAEEITETDAAAENQVNGPTTSSGAGSRQAASVSYSAFQSLIWGLLFVTLVLMAVVLRVF